MSKLKKILIALVVTNVLSGAYIIYRHNIEDVVTSKYPFIDVARNFIPQEDFIVNIQPLREDLNKLVAEMGPDNISLYFEFLNTGANISINPNLDVWPASLPKVPVAMSVMKKVERGEWGLNSELVLFEQDKDMNYGDLWKRPVGTRLTVEELLREMLVNSDNTAYKMFVRNLNFEELYAVVDEVGIAELFTKDGTISAKEYSRLFRALYISSFLKRENSQKILELLTEGEFRGFLSQGVPDEVKFSHKFGEDNKIQAYLDSGIVYVPSRPYIISVAINAKEIGGKEKVEEIMKLVSEKAYTYVTNH